MVPAARHGVQRLRRARPSILVATAIGPGKEYSGAFFAAALERLREGAESGGIRAHLLVLLDGCDVEEFLERASGPPQREGQPAGRSAEARDLAPARRPSLAAGGIPDGAEVVRLPEWAPAGPDPYLWGRIARTREEARRIFLCGGWTHLYFHDCDVIPPKDAIVRLLAHSVPVASGIYPIRGVSEPMAPIRQDGAGVALRQSHLMHAEDRFYSEGAGMGCMLTSRAALEAAPFRPAGYWAAIDYQAHPLRLNGCPPGGGAPCRPAAGVRDPDAVSICDCRLDEPTVLSEDYQWCKDVGTALEGERYRFAGYEGDEEESRGGCSDPHGREANKEQRPRECSDPCGPVIIDASVSCWHVGEDGMAARMQIGERTDGVIWLGSSLTGHNQFGKWTRGVPRTDLSPEQAAQLGPQFHQGPVRHVELVRRPVEEALAEGAGARGAAGPLARIKE